MTLETHTWDGDGPTVLAVHGITANGLSWGVVAEALAAFHRLTVPSVLLYADRGLLDQAPGAYTKENTDGLGVPAVRVPDTNHYSILAGRDGAAAVAARILERSVRS
jgi:pimeloyl-ACP methyl ester carboxylesterase